MVTFLVVFRFVMLLFRSCSVRAPMCTPHRSVLIRSCSIVVPCWSLLCSSMFCWGSVRVQSVLVLWTVGRMCVPLLFGVCPSAFRYCSVLVRLCSVIAPCWSVCVPFCSVCVPHCPALCARCSVCVSLLFRLCSVLYRMRSLLARHVPFAPRGCPACVCMPSVTKPKVFVVRNTTQWLILIVTLPKIHVRLLPVWQ